MSNENLKLWDSVTKTDPKALKEVNFGRKFTAIDPYWQIKEATKLWGSYGITWGFKHIELTYELSTIGIVNFKGVFYYPEGEFPIINACSIYSDNARTKLDTDYAKKVETDTLTKALSKLGFSADVFLSKFVDSPYVNQEDNTKQENQEIDSDLEITLNECKTEQECKDWFKIASKDTKAMAQLGLGVKYQNKLKSLKN